MSHAKTIGVVGAGTMGAGIAGLASQRGLRTILRDVDQRVLDAARRHLEAALRRGVEPAAVDQACCEVGGFPMRPFELMDVVGVHVGLAAIASMWEQGHGEPRWRPTALQRRMVADGRLGAKSELGGFYPPGRSWRDAETRRAGVSGEDIVLRIVAQLVNEAHFAVVEGIAMEDDLDRAVVLGAASPARPVRVARALGAPVIYQIFARLW